MSIVDLKTRVVYNMEVVVEYFPITDGALIKKNAVGKSCVVEKMDVVGLVGIGKDEQQKQQWITSVLIPPGRW
jgi:hypothetical protein